MPGRTVHYFGDYELLEEISRGSMGVVYKARQISLNRMVAVKMLPFGRLASEEFKKRFQIEAEAAASLQHPNIVAIHEVGEHEGQQYFSMDFIEGNDLAGLVRERPLPAKRAASYLKAVAEAIHYAHQQGILHRDLKPSNILIDHRNEPRVTDFGLAKRLETVLSGDGDLTVTGQVLGTPHYMPPEQAGGKLREMTAASDVYSLGAILYHLLTGRPPFLAESFEGTLTQMLQTEPASPRLLNVSVPRDLETICLKCLSKEPRKRYPSAEALAQDLSRWLHHEPILARPVGPAEKLGRWCARNPALASSLAVTLVLLLAVAVGSTAAAVRIGRAEQEQARLRSVEEDLRRRAQAGEHEARRVAAVLRRTAYVGDMALVQQATEDGNLARARSLLDRYRPEAGQDDIRGFEWRYLWGQTRTDETAKLGVYGGSLGGLSVSPDGTYLASESTNGIEIRSSQNHALILTLTNAGRGPIQFSPDSQRLAAVRKTGLIIWNTRTWKEELQLPHAQAPFAFAQHGGRIVAWQNERLSIWDSRTAERIAELPGAVTAGLFQTAIAVSPDGNIIFVGSGSQIRSWDLRTQAELEPMDFPPGRWANGLAVSPQGRLAAAHWNGQVTLWDCRTHQLLHLFQDHLAWVSSVVFSPDGSFLASAGSDQNIFLYETASGKQVRRFKGHEGEIWALQYSRDGHWLISGSDYDQSIRLWDLTNTSQGPVEFGMTLPLRFVDSNRALICFSRKQGFARIAVQTGTVQPLAGWPIPSEISELWMHRAFSVTPDGTRASVVWDGQVQIWNFLSGKLETVLTNALESISCAVFSADGDHLATAGKSCHTRLWKTTDWSAEPLDGPRSGEIEQIAFSPDGSHLALAGEGGVVVFDLASRKSPLSLSHNYFITVTFSPDGKILAAGNEHNVVHVWDLVERRLLSELRGHVSGVNGLSFSPDGRTLASCGDRSVKLWNVETLQEMLTLTRFGSTAWRAVFSADGSCLATSSFDDHVQLWRAPSFEEIAAAQVKTP